MGCGTSNPRTSVSRSSIRNLKSKQTRDFDSVSNEVDLKKQIKPSSISLVVEKSDIVIPESAQIQENIATRQLKDSIDGLEPEAISKVGLSSSSFDSVQNNPDIHYFDGVHQGLQLLCRDEFFSKYTKEKMYKWRPAEIIDVDPLDRSQVVIHYIGWASSFDIRLDLKEDFKNVALIDVVPPLQAEKGYPLDDVQTTITVNYLFTGVLNKNKNAVKRVLSRSQSKSINISSEPYINIDTSRSLITRSKDQTHEVGSVTSSITNSTIRSAPYVPGEMVLFQLLYQLIYHCSIVSAICNCVVALYPKEFEILSIYCSDCS